MIKALIFDLDSCLCAANEVGVHIFQPAAEAIIQANDGSVPEDALKAAFNDCWRFPFDFVAHKYRFTEAMIKAGLDTFAKIEVVKPMRGYGDLHVLKDLPGKLFLVTSGFRRLQMSKVNALGIAHHFTDIHVDAINEPGARGKGRMFEEILRTHSLKPSEVVVIGDNPDSEIAAGNRLGMKTVQILRPGVPRGTNATNYIATLEELQGILAL